MRNRTRPDEREQQQPERSQQRDDREQTGRERSVRVPKIQYRFLKELEQNGVSEDARKGALAMADKIRSYPLEDRAVMGSWERFTKKAIEEFKSGTGRGDERDRQHAAYALLFSSVRDAAPVRDSAELKRRIEAVDDRSTPKAPEQSRQSPQPQQPQQPQQRELLEQGRPMLERQIDTTLARLRDLSQQLRSTIEASARELLVEGHHTPKSARETLPDAIRDLRADHGEKNTVHTLTLAVIARSASHKDLLREVDALSTDARKEVEKEARARLERYPPLETGIADVRKDAIAAVVRDAVDPSPVARREALVLAQAREDIECLADPKRMLWQNVGDELASDLA